MDNERVLIFALYGRDSLLTKEMLSSAGIEGYVCSDPRDLCERIDERAAAVITVEEALTPSTTTLLLEALDAQAVWSDLPIIVSSIEPEAGLAGPVAPLGSRANVLLLQRPVRVQTMLSAVRSALRARQRQREVRNLLARVASTNELLRQRHERASALQELAAAFSAARTTEDVAGVAVSRGRTLVGAAAAFVGLLAENDTVLDLTRSEGFDEDVVSHWQRAPMAVAAPITDAVRFGTPIFCESAEALALRYPHLGGPAIGESGSITALPLAADGRTFGALAFVYDGFHVFDESDRMQATSVARLCAEAIDRALLFELSQSERAAAEQANRSKDEFLAMVSHELRTPLNAVLGWTTLLRGGTLDEAKRARALETVERNARGQAQLVEDLLDISRIVAGKLRLNVGAVELHSTVEAGVETVRPAAVAKGIRLQLVLDPSVGQVAGDPDRLQQVVWNLVSNAVKFTPKGGRVQVTLRGFESNIELVVEDTGAGISKDFLPYVFDRFRQADGGPARRFGGLGLGLAIARHLVELHGGTITVASEGEDRGTAFTVRIPVSPIRQDVAARPTVVRSIPRAGERFECPQELVGLRVLAVDDEPDARALLAEVLEGCDAIVQTAGSVEEALERLEAFRPDVLVSDIGMPELDGYDLIKRVRALPKERGGQTPAVALTAYARTGDRRKALLSGYQMYLSKPIEPAELVVVLANVSGRLGGSRRQGT